mmetsp:Transcript_36090/g.82683  ORF Transcript_36090/g.82683 Transcript_36090/m.82683 type:complete len:87 (+) Transcript_36090:326-586(+)
MRRDAAAPSRSRSECRCCSQRGCTAPSPPTPSGYRSLTSRADAVGILDRDDMAVVQSEAGQRPTAASFWWSLPSALAIAILLSASS